ncbi:MAG: hypothetical protein R2704_11450 [Microthrixaceae bacterium]
MTDPNTPQGPPAGDVPPLGGWAGGPPPGSQLPSRPPVVGSARPPTELAPAWTPPNPDGPPKRPSNGALLAALAAVVAVILLAGGLAIVLSNGADEPRVNAQPESPTTSTPVASPTTTPGGLGEVIGEDPSPSTSPGPSTSAPATTTPADPDPDTEATVDDVISFIEETRGAEFTTRPDVQFQDDAAFEEGLLKDFDEQQEELEDEQVLFHALGMLPADVDLAETMKSALGLGVVGYYDPETEEMVVRGTSLTPYVRTVLAHELTHALDDQLFDLDRAELDDVTDETGYGFTVLTEGSASYVEQAYREQMSAADQARASTEELQAGSDPAIFDIPFVILALLTAPYSSGLELVDSIVDEGGGVDAIPDAFDEPPTTSEETMTPSKYLDHEGSVKVPTPSPDSGAEEVTSGVFGQIGFTALLSTGITLDDPAPGTEGWSGDSYVTWNDESDLACAKIDTVMDSAGDAEDLKAALDNWAAGAPVDATISVSGDEVNLTSCATEASTGGGSPGV